MMNTGFSSSSFFSEERQIDTRNAGFSMNNYSGVKSEGGLKMEAPASSSLENRVPSESPMANGFTLPDYYMNGGRNLNLPLRRHIIGAEREASRSLPTAVDHDLGSRIRLNTDSTSYLFDGERLNLMGAQHENSLFSSSLSDIFSRNLNLSSNNVEPRHSVVPAVPLTSHYEEDEAFESLEELAAKTIGNLLPDDDDLLSGVTDGLGSSVRTNNGEDMEDLDLFSNVGGLELGDDGFSQRASEFSDVKSNKQLVLSPGLNGAEHPFGENPSRTLFVRNINSNVEDSELRALFEQYGEIRTLYTACKHRGFVMISYYDIRAAGNAMQALQHKPLRRRKLDIHFSIPKENPSEKDLNQGTLLVLNVDSSVSNKRLSEIFSAHGEVKEVRESLHGSDCKFIEYFDVRSAESALHALNNSEISGKQIKLEPGHPGGSKRLSLHPLSTKELEESALMFHQHISSSNLTAGLSGSLSLGDSATSTDKGTTLGPFSSNGGLINPLLENIRRPGVPSNGLPNVVRVEPGNPSSFTESGLLPNHLKYERQGLSNLHPHSLPEYRDGLANGNAFGSPNNRAASITSRPQEMIGSPQFRRVNSNGQPIELTEVFGSSGNGSGPPPGHHYIWNNSHHGQAQSILWPNSPTLVNGIGASRPQQLHAVARAPSHIINPIMPLTNHHVGSAPSVNPSPWDRRHAYGESPDAAVFHPGSLGNMGISGNSPHPMEFVPRNIFQHSGGTCMEVPMQSKNIGLHPLHQRGLMYPARGQMLPMIGSFDSANERARTRRSEGSSSQPDNKKQFELDIDRIIRGEDKRTTLMIKNIPNKYTSKMLLAAIDERHKGTYDFIYLPIDFKNKCNVGYAFINMTDPSFIVPFYQTFNGKKWEKFNSEKVASLAYARIQGKSALIAHFQNSSLMNEDKRCRPILFHTDGPNAGDQVPFPMGSNIRPRPGKTRSGTLEESNQEILPNSLSGEENCNGDSSSGDGGVVQIICSGEF
ncbi:protein MEI2-like 4 [Andrographis paniculata]|uniref:protein MEI2-like 4 n=1 Tax=Andrographis paniculata TaxID=175694 RepID=UPI0021E828F8|nr:protein MEI2-like 4 [Andrographis paniculata]